MPGGVFKVRCDELLDGVDERARGFTGHVAADLEDSHRLAQQVLQQRRVEANALGFPGFAPSEFALKEYHLVGPFNPTLGFCVAGLDPGLMAPRFRHLGQKVDPLMVDQ